VTDAGDDRMHNSLGIQDDKYTLTRSQDTARRPRDYPSGSFFPLIEGDALAVMTLRSYANNCLQVIEFGVNPVTGVPLLPEQEAHLRQLGQDALVMADRWGKEQLHLPD
jgi:hypothetical protein